MRDPSSAPSGHLLPRGEKGRSQRSALWLALALAALALALALWTCTRQLPPARWLRAAWSPAPADAAALVFHFSTLPRLVVAALAGAGLAAAGAIFQHVLRNPLASPVTLGVSSGAQLALVTVTVAAPAGFGVPSDLVALVGGCAALAVVLAVASAQRFSSLALILSGLAVGLFLGALGHLLKLFNQEYLPAVFLWSAGALAQDDWSVVTRLLPPLAGLAVLTAVLVQPLRVLGLGDESARGLGLSLAATRVGALGVAVGFAALITAAVGTIGFVEIAAPLIARLAGARRLGPRLVLAPVIGAALLVIVDTLVQGLDRVTGADLPTGAATAFLAAPLLLALLPRMRGTGSPVEADLAGAVALARSPRRVLLPLATLSLLALGLSCAIGRIGTDWAMLSPDSAATLLPWRWPRALTAGAAGALLGAAGTLLQRATGNPLASPEILGLGAAVIAGLAVALLLIPAPPPPVLFGAGAAGALALVAALVGTGWRSRFAPDHLLLTGVALTAALDAVVIAFLALNDGRAGLLLGWMSGSTAGAEAATAITLAGSAAVLVPLGLLFTRGLDLLPLGEPVARGLGLALGPLRFGIMALAALMTAAAVMAVGPLTFVGLVGPHVARRFGLARTVTQLPGAALTGGLVMILADWLGRVALSPFEIPAGLVASLIGCPYLVIQLRRRSL